MAVMRVGTGISHYIEDLEKLKKCSRDYIGQAIYVGADAVADKIALHIEQIPNKFIRADQRRGLQKGLGIAKMQNNGGFWNVKIGFDGYNQHITDFYPAGQPNAMIARAIEGGTYFQDRYPFVDPAVRESKEYAEQLMAAKIDELIEVQFVDY